MTGHNMYLGSYYFSFDTAMKYFGNYLPQLFLFPFPFFFLQIYGGGWVEGTWRLMEKSSSFLFFKKLSLCPQIPNSSSFSTWPHLHSFIHPLQKKNALTSERKKTKWSAMYFWFPSVSYLPVSVSTALNICLNWGKRKRKGKK